MKLINENDDAKSVAKKLQGCQYRDELTGREEVVLEKNRIVVAFGRSDDVIQFNGAVSDETGAWRQSETYFTRDGILKNECEEYDCPNFRKFLESVKYGTVTSETDHDKYGCTHYLTADFPHHKFDVMEDGEKYCVGIAFSLDDVTKTEER